MPGADVGLGGLSTFNMQHGFVEALVRGMRSGFLDDVSTQILCSLGSLGYSVPTSIWNSPL